MAKKLPVAKPAAGAPMQLIDAIAAVKQMQDFIKQHGTWDAALSAVVRVQGLVEITGGFDQLKQALEIVGKDPAPLEA